MRFFSGEIQRTWREEAAAGVMALWFAGISSDVRALNEMYKCAYRFHSQLSVYLDRVVFLALL